jgi:hypothetical protein
MIKNNQQLIKKEYFLKKEKKESERLQKVRRKKIKKIIGILLLWIIVIGGITWGIIGYSSQKQNGHSGIPEIAIDSFEYDFGTVSMAEGMVEHTFEIRNIGQGDLRINRIWTSCMCTTARLKVNGKTSPEFGMHSASMLWSQKISPQQTAYLNVVFDPAYHGPRGIGEIVRVIYLSTNDPENENIKIKLTGNVVR